MNELYRLPSVLRSRLTPLLPDRAFLRRDRENALFVTNAPLFTDAESLGRALSEAGFLCVCSGSLLQISPAPEQLTALENRLEPPDFFCASLARFRGRPPCEEAVSLFARGVRLLEHAAPAELHTYSTDVRRLAAVCLRKNPGGAYACALICAALNQRKELSQ